MKPLDYRTYVISAVIAVITFFVSRRVNEDHDDARKATEEKWKRIEDDLHDVVVQLGAGRSESSRNWLEFKQFKFEKNFRDSLADRTLHRIETHLVSQTTRYRRLVYLPRTMEISEYEPIASDTVKVNFFVKR